MRLDRTEDNIQHSPCLSSSVCGSNSGRNRHPPSFHHPPPPPLSPSHDWDHYGYGRNGTEPLGSDCGMRIQGAFMSSAGHLSAIFRRYRPTLTVMVMVMARAIFPSGWFVIRLCGHPLTHPPTHPPTPRDGADVPTGLRCAKVD